MTTRLPGIADLVGAYDVFLVDQFGTLHDGERPYPGAAEALRKLRAAGRKAVLLSNSGKRAAPNISRLARLGIPPEHYDLLVSSGEVAWRMLHEGAVPELRNTRTCLLLSRGDDRSAIEGTGICAVADGSQADVVVIAGSEGDKYPMSHYEKLLLPAARRRIPALCTNPDLTMLVGPRQAFGAGRIAETYEHLGGKVIWIGKPHPEIYERVLAEMGGPPRNRVIGIGDSLAHDVKGAHAAGCHSALVLTGLSANRDEVRRDSTDDAVPEFVLDAFIWN